MPITAQLGTPLPQPRGQPSPMLERRGLFPPAPPSQPFNAPPPARDPLQRSPLPLTFRAAPIQLPGPWGGGGRRGGEFRSAPDPFGARARSSSAPGRPRRATHRGFPAVGSATRSPRSALPQPGAPYQSNPARGRARASRSLEGC